MWFFSIVPRRGRLAGSCMVIFRETGNARTNFVLFSYAGNFLKEQSIRVGVINNIWLFVPLGTGLYRIFQKKWVLVVLLVFSVLIEATQYITGLGIAEFDDVFGNTLGGWIGVVVTWTWVKNKAMRTTRWKIWEYSRVWYSWLFLNRMVIWN